MAMRLAISDEMIETLKSHVSFGTRADLQDFVADAMNTYIQLGALVARGNNLYVQRMDQLGTPLVPLRLPVQTQPLQPQDKTAGLART